MTDQSSSGEPVDHTGPKGPDIEALLRELSEDDRVLNTPPPGLWADIAAAADGPSASSGAVTDDPSTPQVASLARRRLMRATPGRIMTAAAASLILLVGVFALAQSLTDDSQLVASASLRHDATFDPIGAQATAAVSLRNEADSLVLFFDSASLPDVDDEQADLELWLIRPDVDGGVADLVSLGVIDSGHPGPVRVPESVDPDEFFVVDISIEPRDGDERHSGRSILRGPLDA